MKYYRLTLFKKEYFMLLTSAGNIINITFFKKRYKSMKFGRICQNNFRGRLLFEKWMRSGISTAVFTLH